MSLTDEWINKTWWIQTMECCFAIKRKSSPETCNTMEESGRLFAKGEKNPVPNVYVASCLLPFLGNVQHREI